jgi:steroid delta-isomerase-like uncharacterized protein
MSKAEVVSRWADALNSHDATAFAEVYAPNATVRDPAYPEPLEGRDAIRGDVETYFAAFPDFWLKVRSVLETDAHLAYEVTFGGTHTGPLVTDTGEVPPTGRRIEVDGAAFNRLDGQGRILDQNRYFDLASMFAQLQIGV